MTYIEFFDKTSVENICACLAMTPDEVVLVGDNAKAMQRHIENYKEIFKDRGKEIDFSYKKVSRWKTDEVVAVLTKIVEEHKDCVFGITGGDEIVLFALGIIYERSEGKNIQVHRISIQNNRIYDCDMDGKVIDHQNPKLSVEENIRIYGGEVVKRMKNGKRIDIWDMNAAFKTEIEEMWTICKEDPKSWNIQMGVFETIGKVGSTSEDGMTVTASLAEIKKYYKENTGYYSVKDDLIEKLKNKNLISEFEENDDIVTVTYKNTQVKRCLTKAGQALEMKIYMIARELRDEEDQLLYNDVMNGVEIDWDGEDVGNDKLNANTMNEIDVLLMHDMVPVFVSCKNGAVKAEELYKLNTVAERFGGKYAKKILVSSMLPNLENEESFKKRAQDMHIHVITGHTLMNDVALTKSLRHLWM